MAPRIRLGLSLLVFAGVIFRAELAILLTTVSIYLLLAPLASLQQLIRPGLVAFFAAVLLSVPIDSYFWQRPMWPELAGFYYNAVQGKSSDWGTSAWHYYFTSALPRLLNPLAFIWALWNPVTASAARAVSIPSLAFTAIYSLQPHKETRFIIYVVPPLTAAAALGLNHVFIRRGKSALYALGSLVLVLSVLATFAASTGMLLLSSLNYPGGEALAHLRSLVQRDVNGDGVRAVSAHADVLSCMTGVTLFEIEAGGAMPAHRPLRNNENDKPVSTSLPARGANGSRSAVLKSPALTMDRTEDRVTLRDPKFWKRFDYLLMEDPAKAQGGEWDTVAVVQGYAGIEFLRPGQKAASDTRDTEHGERTVGKGALVTRARDIIRRLSGGWWIGPRMEPKIRIMKRRKGTSQATQPAVA
jgi:alpha-1,6-mannosyltransferase